MYGLCCWSSPGVVRTFLTSTVCILINPWSAKSRTLVSVLDEMTYDGQAAFNWAQSPLSLLIRESVHRTRSLFLSWSKTIQPDPCSNFTETGVGHLQKQQDLTRALFTRPALFAYGEFILLSRWSVRSRRTVPSYPTDVICYRPIDFAALLCNNHLALTFVEA